MSIEGEILSNAGQDSVEPSSEPVDAEAIQADVDKALENDPQRKLAKQVEADLAAAGVDGGEIEAKDTKQPVDPEYQEAKNRVAQALRERNKGFKEREAAKQEAESIRQEAMKMKVEAEAFAQNVKAQQAQLQNWMMMLRQNPVEALKAANLDPEEFLLGIARDGTPEGQLQKQLKEQQRKLDEFDSWKRKQHEDAQKAQYEYLERQKEQFRNQVETEFLNRAQSDKYTSVNKALANGLLSKQALVLEADSIADKYRAATGQEASYDEILEYIDTQVSTAISKITGNTQANVSSVNGKPAKAQPAQTKKVGQSLSLDDSSERRSLSRDLSNASAEERREAAMRAVKLVLQRDAK